MTKRSKQAAKIKTRNKTKISKRNCKIREKKQMPPTTSFAYLTSS